MGCVRIWQGPGLNCKCMMVSGKVRMQGQGDHLYLYSTHVQACLCSVIENCMVHQEASGCLGLRFCVYHDVDIEEWAARTPQCGYKFVWSVQSSELQFP
ncbi:hypothetical protein PoB_002559500 [Plakobranchus ocellatus]|uniref:Uncharacterized protein n=1 Tax=Plakobranchus ocellatus TaxID=259542 RepID=A0AAV3ZV83_9GAST|nr:hypothetical protein PoB_002559500 [Plakobranchus ocellatus]